MVEKKKFKILSIGFDSFLTKEFKKITDQTDVKVDVTFMSEIKPSALKAAPDLLVYFSQQHSGKNIKWVRDLLFNQPHLHLVMILPKPDYQAAINYFRLGVLDVWSYPFDENEIGRSLQRARYQNEHLKDHPLKMALHLFSQPQIYETISELAQSWLEFLQAFALSVQAREIHSSEKVLSELKKQKVRILNSKKLRSFLDSRDAFMFGITKDLILIKFSSDFYFLISIKFSSNIERSKVLNPYSIHLIKGVRDNIHHQTNQKELERLVLTDEITGLFNQRKLIIDLENSVRECNQRSDSFSLLFIDIDYFKNVNDQYGHVTGSQLLIDMAQVLRTELRGADAIYRFGGDEFIVLLPHTKLEEAKKIALRLSEGVKGMEFSIGKDKTYRLSLSIGLAEYPSDAATSKDIIEFADKMMYMSKKSGRGKVFHVNEVL